LSFNKEVVRIGNCLKKFQFSCDSEAPFFHFFLTSDTPDGLQTTLLFLGSLLLTRSPDEFSMKHRFQGCFHIKDIEKNIYICKYICALISVNFSTLNFGCVNLGKYQIFFSVSCTRKTIFQGIYFKEKIMFSGLWTTITQRKNLNFTARPGTPATKKKLKS
jgi:hypothetical protein